MSFSSFSQVHDSIQSSANTEKVWRVNVISPGVELELPTSKETTFSINAGVGYDGSYRNLSGSSNGWIYVIAPFLDLHYKWFYNLENRVKKGYNISNNSGNFIGLRMLSHGPSIDDNVNRYAKLDFVFSPVWGIQRSYGDFHLMFDAGPVYYTDINGNSGLFILALELNLGFNF